jgi:hypothetical protein
MKKKDTKTTRYIKDQLLAPYYIQLDDYCFGVHKAITAEESGKEYHQTLGFYKNLDSALSAIAKDEVMSKNYDTIKSFIEEYNNIINRISNIITL